MTDAKNNTFYVTTPIYYVNDKPHLGHVYTTMVADVVARYHRLKGDETFFLTGVDEHAAKVSDKAAEHDMTPQQWADQNAAAFRETFEKLEMTNNDFVRTSSDHHKAKVTEYVTALLNSGDVYEGEYEGWYDAGQEEYIPENKAKASDYKSEVNGKPLVKKTEKNYFFKLESYRDQVIEAIKSGRFDVQPEARKNEILNRLADAKDIPISRSGTNGWGIPVPGTDDQTIYVWIDALFNYLTYTDTPERRKFWTGLPDGEVAATSPSRSRGATHFIAKDILWFHAAIWPAVLIALQKCDGYDWVNLPKCVYSHSYWVSDTGEKMSKSLGNFLDPKAIDNYVAEFGLDALRYFLATRGPLGTTDSAFSPELFAEVYNSDLANTFGNSCSRVMNMTAKYFDGMVPEGTSSEPELDAVSRLSGEQLEELGFVHDAENNTGSLWDIEKVSNAMLAKNIRGSERGLLERLSPGLARTFASYGKISDVLTNDPDGISIVQLTDSYIEKTAPFKLAKDMDANGEQVATILYNCLEALRIASVLLWPFIPHKVEEFWSRIGFEHYTEALKDNGLGDLEAWTQWGHESGGLKPGTPIEKGQPLFPRYESPK